MTKTNIEKREREKEEAKIRAAFFFSTYFITKYHYFCSKYLGSIRIYKHTSEIPCCDASIQVLDQAFDDYIVTMSESNYSLQHQSQDK